MQQNRLNEFQLPISDIDLDPVKFTRFPWGSSYGSINSLSVDANSGVLKWNPGNSPTGLYTVIIKMADYDYRYCSPPVTSCSSSRKVSEVMVDFFVEVVQKQAICRDGCTKAGQTCTVGSNGQCGSCSGSGTQCVDNSPPAFVSPTPADQSTLLAVQGQSVQFQIKAQDSFSFDTVTLQPSWSISPSPVLTGALSGLGSVTVSFSWSVPSSATTAYQACFYASDQRQASSGQHCVIIKVGLMAVTKVVRNPDKWPQLAKNEGYSPGGDTLDVTGVNFGGGSTYKCKFRASGSNPSRDVAATYVSPTLVRCNTPDMRGKEGTYSVDVSKDNGQRYTNDGIKFTFHPACPGYPNNMCGGRGTCSNGQCNCAPYSGNACQYLCGNGINEPTEECDDGNTAGGDGCTAGCKIQSGCTCNGSPKSICQCCGNGRREGSETCDDGNFSNGDGCSSACSTEPGWFCTTASPNVCEKCGNGKLEGAETCDDGNLANGDGCTSSCRVENGYTCTGTPSQCENCGNGRMEHTETCDDGNKVSGDGCSSTCKKEGGFTCTGTPSVCHNCGNGKREGPEKCDDGNVTPGDGCSATCTIENGYTCSSGNPTVCQKCGNGKKEGTESCDDANITPGDGCSATCTIEGGYTCTLVGQQSQCRKCGNSKVEFSEGCDDGNTANGDGCSNVCQKENGWTCDTNTPNRCHKCGNGVVEYPNIKEQCDDGNTVAGDGCSATCQNEGGWTCDTSKKPTVCQKCGNGKIEGTEECDDNNVNDNDGCSSSCAKEGGWTCNGIPSVCQKCGNSIREGTEACDDGNSNTGDGCTPACEVEDGWNCPNNVCTAGPTLCGDGTIQTGETCDDGNRNSGDGCSSTCAIENGFTCNGTPSVCFNCGNGRIETPEVCDDGNNNNGDGCDSACAKENGWTCNGDPSVCQLCGNGKIEGTEKCDDSNLNGGDGCSSSCTIEGGFTCNGQPSVCQNCGNGKREGTESCDDGNTSNNDGCSSVCAVESGFTCALGTPDVCEKCGNGIIEGTEKCDDNDLNEIPNVLQDGDGCSSTCQIEGGGWVCTGSSNSKCENCGNGLMEHTETCDDGNSIANDGCTNCVIDSGYTCNGTDPSLCWNCGNGIKEPYEDCDDGNTADNDGCNANCDIEPGYSCVHFTADPSICQRCGNGRREGTENCDDNNTNNGDGCDSTCNPEPGWTCAYNQGQRDVCENCGNGIIEGQEQCDDGNTTATFDGCDSACQIEDEWTCEYDSSLKKSVCKPIVPIPLTAGILYDLTFAQYDSSPPWTDIDYTSSPNTLTVRWEGFTQPDSCDIRLGTSPKGFELMDWTVVGNVTGFKNSSMTLEDKAAYYWSVRCINAQNKYSFGYSDGIIVDFTPPIEFLVFDALGQDDTTWTSNKSIVHSSWSVLNDAESDISQTLWGLGTTPGGDDVVRFFQLGDMRMRELSYPGLDLKHSEINGLTYYVSLRVCNTVQLCRTESANGFQVDLLPPAFQNRDIIYDGPLRGEDLTFSNGGNSISANWNDFLDFGSGVDHVELAIGKVKGQGSVQGWSDIGLTTDYTRYADKLATDGQKDFLNHSETYYTGIRLVDQVGHVKEVWSDGFTVDATPPVFDGVVDGGTAGFDVNETGSKILRATWNSLDDPESGIKTVEIAVLANRNRTLTEVLNFTTVSTTTFGAVTGFELINNETYFLVVRATNGALGQTIVTTTGVRYIEGLPAGAEGGGAGVKKEPFAKREQTSIIAASVATAGVIGAGIAGFLGFRSLKKKRLADRKKAMRDARREAAQRKSTLAADRSAFNIEPLENDVELEWNNLVDNEMRDEVETAGAG
eukprot:TRINITY_DN4804_c0_g1_i3.p1 TRINITY_DN4804_c0_g1~~TRINITY_DN4804_c0_g1_i3.p1  ORF type:complete len:2031 (+),score=541.93 TRINITY_DN4804_c0_g1_i3:650-6094(+)